MECKVNENLTHCTCTYEPCSRKGICCECVEYHRRNNEIPGCFFTKKGERSYDRSVRRFIEDQS
jgi:hypothetical protein